MISIKNFLRGANSLRFLLAVILVVGTLFFAGCEEGDNGDGTPNPGGDGTPPPGGDGTPNPGGDGTPNPGGDGTPNPGGDKTPDPSVEVSENFRNYTLFLGAPLAETPAIEPADISIDVIFTPPSGGDCSTFAVCGMDGANMPKPPFNCRCTNVTLSSLTINSEGSIEVSLPETYTFNERPARVKLTTNFQRTLRREDADDPLADTFIESLPRFRNPAVGGRLPDITVEFSFPETEGGRKSIDSIEYRLAYLPDLNLYSPLTVKLGADLQFFPHLRYLGSIYVVSRPLYEADDCTPAGVTGQLQVPGEHVKNSFANAISAGVITAEDGIVASITGNSDVLGSATDFRPNEPNEFYYFANLSVSSALGPSPTLSDLPNSFCASEAMKLAMRVVTLDTLSQGIR